MFYLCVCAQLPELHRQANVVINDNQLILGKETNVDGEVYTYILGGCQEFHR